jgi:hypothetical protein
MEEEHQYGTPDLIIGLVLTLIKLGYSNLKSSELIL